MEVLEGNFGDVKTHKVGIYRKFSISSFAMKYHWRIWASNGERICKSDQGFFNKEDCIYNAKTTGKSLVNHFKNI